NPRCFTTLRIVCVRRTTPSLPNILGNVLRFLGCGLSNKEIARELSVSVGTVKHHVHLPRRVSSLLIASNGGAAIRRNADTRLPPTSAGQGPRNHYRK